MRGNLCTTPIVIARVRSTRGNPPNIGHCEAQSAVAIPILKATAVSKGIPTVAPLLRNDKLFNKNSSSKLEEVAH